MKKALLVIAFVLAAVTSTNAQVMNQMEDRLALRSLVDTFSVLADYKNTDEQQLLFTEDAEMISMENGKVVSDLKGRKQIGDACEPCVVVASTHGLYPWSVAPQNQHPWSGEHPY